MALASFAALLAVPLVVPLVVPHILVPGLLSGPAPQEHRGDRMSKGLAEASFAQVVPWVQV